VADLALFAAILTALIGGAWLFTRIRGIKAHHTETFPLDADEKLLFEDVAADFYVVPVLGQALVMSFARMGRAHVLVTNHRIIVGQKVLLGRKHMVTDVILLTLVAGAKEDLNKMTGGQFTLGYRLRLGAPDKITVAVDGKKPYLRITLSDVASSANVEHCRLYTEKAAEAHAKILPLAG
jgi:hypothetical protein